MVDSAQGGRILEAPVLSSLREVGGVRKTPKRLSTLLRRGTDLLEEAHNVQTRIG